MEKVELMKIIEILSSENYVLKREIVDKDLKIEQLQNRIKRMN